MFSFGCVVFVCFRGDGNLNHPLDDTDGNIFLSRSRSRASASLAKQDFYGKPPVYIERALSIYTRGASKSWNFASFHLFVAIGLPGKKVRGSQEFPGIAGISESSPTFSVFLGKREFLSFLGQPWEVGRFRRKSAPEPKKVSRDRKKCSWRKKVLGTQKK